MSTGKRNVVETPKRQYQSASPMKVVMEMSDITVTYRKIIPTLSFGNVEIWQVWEKTMSASTADFNNKTAAVFSVTVHCHETVVLCGNRSHQGKSQAIA